MERLVVELFLQKKHHKKNMNHKKNRHLKSPVFKIVLKYVVYQSAYS